MLNKLKNAFVVLAILIMVPAFATATSIDQYHNNTEVIRSSAPIHYVDIASHTMTAVDPSHGTSQS